MGKSKPEETSGPSKPKYDDREALSLISEYGERLLPSSREIMNAVGGLIGALDGLSGKAGLDVHPARERPGDHISRWVYLNGEEPGVKVVFDPTKLAFLLYLKEGGTPCQVKLRYDRIRDVLEGDEEDSFIVPTPGEPRGRRPGLAVLVEGILKFIEKSKPKK